MSTKLNCYNRGCGQIFDPNDNNEDVCQHHPGLPFFHDAYKGWTCCNKKSVDFTEFLNIKGCSFSKHSNEKPPEMPKSVVDKENAHVPVEVNVRKPVETHVRMERPPFDAPLTKLRPSIAEILKQKTECCPHSNKIHDKFLSADCIILGTKCKNGGCGGEYLGPESNDEECVHHPGVPIFHEGLKYWSCCQKRTTDFNAFLNQVGCNKGSHKWKKEVESTSAVKCRWDWHQTGSYVMVAVYAKDYNPMTSWVKINPIRLCIQLEFPNEGGAKFNLDLELKGVINVSESSASMYGTKVEIKLHKSEPGSWVKLDIPRPEVNKEADKSNSYIPNIDLDDDLVDLSDVEPVKEMGRINITEVTE